MKPAKRRSKLRKVARSVARAKKIYGNALELLQECVPWDVSSLTLYAHAGNGALRDMERILGLVNTEIWRP